MKSNFFLIIWFLILLSSSNAQQLTVGVTPDILDLGELEPGSSNIARFYIVTISNETLLVDLSIGSQNENIFNRDEYKRFFYNYSEQDIKNWIKFLSNPVELEPKLSGRKEKEIKGWREIVFIVDVPNNAEPGYHTIKIVPDPRVVEQGETGFMIKGVIPVNLIFNVPGKAVRDGEILDVTTGGYVHGMLETNIFFENKGTVSMFTKKGEVKIYDKYGRLVDTLDTNTDFFEPGDVKVLKAYWDTRDRDYSDYNVSVSIGYKTSTARKVSTITLEEKPTPVPSGEIIKKGFKIPWFLLIIPVIIIIGYLYYRR